MEVDDDEDLEETKSRINQTTLLGAQPSIGENVGDWFIERSKYTPVRLTMEERKLLRLLEAALGKSSIKPCHHRRLNIITDSTIEVSDYTDRIGALTFCFARPQNYSQPELSQTFSAIPTNQNEWWRKSRNFALFFPASSSPLTTSEGRSCLPNVTSRRMRSFSK